MPYRFEKDPNRRSRRRALYTYVLDSQEHMTDLTPYFTKAVATLQRVANGRTATPNRGTDVEMSRYLQIKEETFELYLSGKISLKDLLTRRGEYKISVSKAVSVDSIIQDVFSLPDSKRLEVLSRIASAIQGKKEPEVVKIPTISLDADEKDKLRKLFFLSLQSDEREPKDLIELGVAPDLIEYLISSPIEVEFTAEDYKPLLPFLYQVTKWVEKKSGLTPMIDLEKTYEGSLDKLLTDLRFGQSKSSEGCSVSQ